MGSRGASAALNATQKSITMGAGGLLDDEYASRVTKREGYTDGYESRYVNDKSFVYDGDTFIVDDNKRGGTTADGKRTMMFPDEILFARAGMVQDYLKNGEKGGLKSYMQEIRQRMVEARGSYSNAADERTNNNLIEALNKALGK